MGDAAFMRAFETATLGYEEWTHEAHLRMAWNYITAYGREEATPLIKCVSLRPYIATGKFMINNIFFFHRAGINNYINKNIGKVCKVHN